MVRLTVISRAGILLHSEDFATHELAQSWIQHILPTRGFGRPDRWVHQNDLKALGEDRTKAVASEMFGSPDEEFYRFRFVADYSVSVEEIDLKRRQHEINSEAIAYLNATDWYVTRKAETGIEIPKEIIERRHQARMAIV